MMGNYQKQAKDFLDKTKTEFKAQFVRNGKYFPDDTDKRDVYEITLIRGSRNWSFMFGQSIANSGGYDHMGRRPIKRTRPTPYDVLACITKYDPETFENFCGAYGYDTDSKKAEKTYHAVMDEWQNIKALYSDEEIELLAEIV